MKVFLTACLGLLLAGTPPARAQVVNTNRTAVVRAYEVTGSQNLMISYGEGQREGTKLEGKLGRKNQQITTDQLQEVIERFYNEGYHLVGMASGGMPNGLITTFVFRRD